MRLYLFRDIFCRIDVQLPVFDVLSGWFGGLIRRQSLTFVLDSSNFSPISRVFSYMNKSIQQAEENFLKTCIQYASIALIYYDYVLTLQLEVTHMWNSKFKLSTLLYILTRYALVANVLYLLAMSSKLSNCDSWYRAIAILSMLGRASVIVVFSLRTYAIWNRNKFILVWFGMLGVACVIFDALQVPGLRCKGSSSSQLQATLLSVFVCILELSAAVLTMLSAVRSRKRLSVFQAKDLPGFVYRQGVLYFCGVFVFTAAAMILNFVVNPHSFLIRLLNAITLPFSCLLTSRFLLNLRSESNRSKHFIPGTSTQQTRSILSSLNFGVRSMADEFGHVGDSPEVEVTDGQPAEGFEHEAEP